MNRPKSARNRIEKGQPVEDRTLLGTPNMRRANRVPIDRPVRIVAPSAAAGKMVNVSATGMLIHVSRRAQFGSGERVSLEIPRLDGKATLVRVGRVVRVEAQEMGMDVAIDLV
jgi:hypothetical protein